MNHHTCHDPRCATKAVIWQEALTPEQLTPVRIYSCRAHVLQPAHWPEQWGHMRLAGNDNGFPIEGAAA